ncbi:MlaD family protein [Patulibacter defluvii]|uniref:MlaD family protein n=1 Tax=Patulibacter defluvii TaxID=3095358 RepID=UPI002A74C25F|nr:MlaD family protein [Patulibacter sp. DM4]
MPAPHSPVARLLAALAVVAVAVAATVVLRGGGPAYRVAVELTDAGQLVKGNLVKVGGATVGLVRSIRLSDRGRAIVELEIDADGLAPLHRGTRAIVRNASLSSVAGRYVSLEPGRNDAPELPSGSTIAAVDTRSATDIDIVLNLLDQRGRDALRSLIRGGAAALDGQQAALAATLERLAPALGRFRIVSDGLAADQRAFSRLLAGTAGTAAALADGRADLRAGVRATAATVDAVAARRTALRRTVARAPTTIARARTTLRRTRALLADARPLLRETAPVAPRLARTLRVTRPLVARARPLLEDVRATLPLLDDALRVLPGLRDQALPALRETAPGLRELRPIVAEARPYVPDLLAGSPIGYAGRIAGYYDGNGHIARVQALVNASALPAGLRELLPALTDGLAPALGAGLNTFQRGLGRRCPGAGVRPLADGSNPWPAGLAGGCDPRQVLPAADGSPGGRR